MAKSTPVLENNSITFPQSDGVIHIADITEPRQHQQFLEILETYKTFRFVDSSGFICSVIKELRASFGDKENKKPVWYCHKRKGKKLYRVYVGKADNLTSKNLNRAARKLKRQMK